MKEKISDNLLLVGLDINQNLKFQKNYLLPRLRLSERGFTGLADFDTINPIHEISLSHPSQSINYICKRLEQSISQSLQSYLFSSFRADVQTRQPVSGMLVQDLP